MKKVTLLLILALATISISAQESGVSSEAGRKTTFVRNGFWDNWFVGLGGGASIYLGDMDWKADLQSRFNIAPTLYVGKWWDPIWGARAKFDGGALHTFLPKKGGGTTMNHFHHLTAQVDLLFNVSNYLGTYNENRFYSFIPYVGIGFDHMFDKDWKSMKDNSATWNVGFLNTFRLSNKLSAFLDISGEMVQDSFERVSGGQWEWDGIAYAQVGIHYKIGKKHDFSEAVLMDQGLINDLNSQINRLRQDNERLSRRPESCPKCEEKIIEKIIEKPGKDASFISNVVFFRLNSANIDANQEVSIFNTAKYLKDNPNAKVKVVGYADKKTGTATINQKLSERRAKNVANQLINKYKIDSNRVSVDWKGDTVQPYAENEWNRVAIFFAE